MFFTNITLQYNSTKLFIMGFDVFKSEKNGKYYFNLKAKNSQVILVSQGYADMSGVKSGISSVKRNCANADNFIVKNSTDGKVFFNLIAGNNQVIGHSQVYSSKDSANKGIASVRENAPQAEITMLGHKDQ